MKRILLTLFSVASLANAATKPNILFFFADDQRADTIAALGNPGKRCQALWKQPPESLARAPEKPAHEEFQRQLGDAPTETEAPPTPDSPSSSPRG
jgi:hypothetical protein